MKVEKIMTKPYGAAIEAINYDLAHYESFDKDPKFERCQEKTEQCRAAIAALKDYEKVKAEFARWKPLIEAAGKVDKDLCDQSLVVATIELVGSKNEWATHYLDQLRALLSALPDKED